MHIEITAEYLASQGFSKTLPTRFWKKVNKSGPIPQHCPERGPCWPWTARTNPAGYGIISTTTSRNALAHRVAWIIHYGPIPESKLICHHCDNPPCVNPMHMFIGTHLENSADAMIKYRVACGDRLPQTKLKQSEVLEIRQLAGEMSQRELALRFGVGQASVSDVINRKRWKHV